MECCCASHDSRPRISGQSDVQWFRQSTLQEAQLSAKASKYSRRLFECRIPSSRHTRMTYKV
eukprot:5335934-Amphidinium_carterae.1